MKLFDCSQEQLTARVYRNAEIYSHGLAFLQHLQKSKVPDAEAQTLIKESIDSLIEAFTKPICVFARQIYSKGQHVPEEEGYFLYKAIDGDLERITYPHGFPITFEQIHGENPHQREDYAQMLATLKAQDVTLVYSMDIPFGGCFRGKDGAMERKTDLDEGEWMLLNPLSEKDIASLTEEGIDVLVVNPESITL